MVVFIGESGDTDYEGLVGGTHKTVILKGVYSNAITQLPSKRNYPLSDVFPSDSSNVYQTPEDCTGSNIRSSLEHLGVLKG